VLGDRDGHAVDVDFLKGVGADHGKRHLPGDRHQRDGVEPRIGDRRHQVRRPGARSEAHRGFARHPRHALSHEAGTLLVAREHMPDPFRLAQGVVERQDRPAGNAHDRLYPLLFQQAHDQFAPVIVIIALLLVAGKNENPLGRLAPEGVGFESVIRFDPASVPPGRTQPYAYAYEQQHGQGNGETDHQSTPTRLTDKSKT